MSLENISRIVFTTRLIFLVFITKSSYIHGDCPVNQTYTFIHNPATDSCLYMVPSQNYSDALETCHKFAVVSAGASAGINWIFDNVIKSSSESAWVQEEGESPYTDGQLNCTLLENRTMKHIPCDSVRNGICELTKLTVATPTLNVGEVGEHPPTSVPGPGPGPGLGVVVQPEVTVKPETNEEDACYKNNGGCSQICLTLPLGERSCSCGLGYTLANWTKCVDMNECYISNGECEHYCTNVEGSRICSCQEGWYLQHDRKTCRDVNECQKDNGGCAHNCQNHPGSFSCSCKPQYHLRQKRYCDCTHGYMLDSDGKQCVSTSLLHKREHTVGALISIIASVSLVGGTCCMIFTAGATSNRRAEKRAKLLEQQEHSKILQSLRNFQSSQREAPRNADERDVDEKPAKNFLKKKKQSTVAKKKKAGENNDNDD